MSAKLDIACIVIGGSAGSLPVLFELIKSIPVIKIPIVIVIHRQRSGNSELHNIFSSATGKLNIIEPEDKEPLNPSSIYIAPQNYHLLIEKDLTLSLDYSEPVKYSRPSIDVTFQSFAYVFRNKLAGIILSGANSDGTKGLQKVTELGGVAIAQAIETAQYPEMPGSAIAHVKNIRAMAPKQIISFINDIASHGK